MSIGAQIRRAREGAGLSQREVADATHGVLSAAGLSRIESGQRYPTLRSLEALSVAPGLRVVIERGRTGVVSSPGAIFLLFRNENPISAPPKMIRRPG
jgi:transcriptional regulator with XRE-family HTH domain